MKIVCFKNESNEQRSIILNKKYHLHTTTTANKLDFSHRKIDFEDTKI